MTETYGILSLLPPLLGIGLAFWKKQIIASLFLAIWLGEILIVRGNVFTAFMRTMDDTIRVAGAKGNFEIILFSVLVGCILALIRESNGFQGFLDWFERRPGLKGRRAVFGLTYLLGISIFIENYSNILINGSTMRPLFDRMRISRERLGYFLHTISINSVALVVINSWGAFYLSLLATQNVAQPLRLVVGAIPLNFYCLASLVLVAVVMATGLTIGPMRKAEARVRESAAEKSDALLPEDLLARRRAVKPSALHMVFPIVTLLATIILFLFVTGGGSITRGSGSSAVFYGVMTTILLTGALLLIRKVFNFQGFLDVVFKGMSELLPVGVLLVLALTLGDLSKRMGTGVYLADLVKQGIPAFLLPCLIFGLSCVISFATGTSYGTFAIMVPIAMPMAAALGLNQYLMFAACIGGGVFGDNCSPISDTSIVTGMAARIDVVEHARTQLPYALISASFALLAFLLAGALL